MPKLDNKLQWPDFNFRVMLSYHDASSGINSRHTHEDYYEMVFVRSGTATHCCEETSKAIHPGEVFLLVPGQTHHYICKGNLTIYNILFSEGFVRHILAMFPADQAIEAFLKYHPQRLRPPQIRKPAQKIFLQLVSLAEEIQVVQTQAVPRSQMIISLNFIKMLLLLTQTKECDDPAEMTIGDSAFRIHCLIHLLNTHFCEKWTLESMANHCHLSVSRFRLCFQAVTGLPPGTWLLRHRIYRAAQLLMTTEQSISDITAICGFSDSNYFTRQFHRIVGTTPHKFRQNPRQVWPQISDC